MEPIYRPLPTGFRFRPTDCEISKYFLKKKTLGQPMKTRTIPEDCNDIFSRHPRDLPGYPREEHWYYFCRKHNNQVTTNSHNLWTPIREETNVLDPKNNGELVGIKRSFALIEKNEDKKEYDWFMDEIRLPLTTVADTVWVLCHIFGEEIEPEVPIDESESGDEESVC